MNIVDAPNKKRKPSVNITGGESTERADLEGVDFVITGSSTVDAGQSHNSNAFYMI